MSPADLVSLVMMVAGPVVFLATLRLVRARRGLVVAALVAGLFVAAANSMVEVVVTAHDVFRVRGLLSVLGTPLSRTFGWVWLGAAMCLQYDVALRRARNRWLVRCLVVLVAIAAGLVFDYLGTGPLGFLEIGSAGGPYHIVLVWLVLVPATLGLFEWLRPERRRPTRS